MTLKLYTIVFKCWKQVTLSFIALSIFGIAGQAQYTIFNPATEGPAGGPGGAEANIVDPSGGVELGIRFRVTVAGTVDAIRYYKGSTNLNSTTHVGTLWDNTGVPLASVTFTGETADGWQEMAFTTPVLVAAGTTYTVSYWGDEGVYALTSGGLNNLADDVSRTPFIIIANTGGASAADPGNEGNGVYTYITLGGALAPVSPTGANYWVDLRFTPLVSLPVTLVDFDAKIDNGNIALSWKTETEHSSKGFMLQRSNNGTDWYDVKFINSQGESNILQSYGYTDKGLAPGRYYYRLKQMDLDGKFTWSAIVTGKIAGIGTIALYPSYPNPVQNFSQIRFDLPATQQVRLSIFDMHGREIQVLLNGRKDAGSHITNIDATRLSKQLYFVRLQTESGTLIRKIVVQ